MATQTTTADEREQRFGEIVYACLNAAERGEQPNREHILAEHPEFASELTEFLSDLDNVDQLAAPLRSVLGPLVSKDRHEGLVAHVLGDFHILREVGRGGMGVVYEAEQITLGRRVALKVLPFAATMDPKHLQRFHNEARAAASLHHEHIVPVYGVGSERGVHYYAMQFIEGQTLAQLLSPSPFAGEGRGEGSTPTKPIAGLTTEPGKPTTRDHYRRIAELIADAADALEFAHSMGVVHRDVKPGNLMVDGAGKLWVTDFGLARFGTDAGLTMTGDLLGTLRYMAPEQALAKHGLADHRVDVYGLGATLYESLTGRPAVSGTDKQEILNRLAFEEPVAPRKLVKSIPAELETITLQCLAKEPTERYPSAGELANDLRRWLGNQSIKAKPPTLLDRTGRWARRHRGGIAATVAFLILATTGLSAGVVLLAKKESETRQANSSAQKRLEQLEKANDLLGSVFHKLDPSAEEKGGPTLREQLTAQLRQAIQELDGEAVGDELTVAKIQDSLGQSLLGLGEPGEAVPLFEKAVATRQRLLGHDHEDTLCSQGNLASALCGVGRYAEAIHLDEFVRAAQVAKLGADDSDTLETLNSLAMAYLESGKVSESIPLFEQVRTARVIKLGSDHPDTLTSLNNLALAYLTHDKWTEAIRLLEQVRDIKVAKLGSDHRSTLTTLLSLGEAYCMTRRLPDAVRLFEQVRDASVAKLGAHHPVTLGAFNNLASAYVDTGRFLDAIRLYEHVRNAFDAKFGAEHPRTLATLSNLAGAYRLSGKMAESIGLYEKVRSVQVAKLGADHPNTLTTSNNLALAYQTAGRLPDAIRLFEEMRVTIASKLGADHPHTLTTLHNLGRAYWSSGNLPGAILVFEEAASGIARIRFQHPNALRVVTDTIDCYEQSNDLGKAENWRRKWLTVVKETSGPESPEYAAELRGLGSNLLRAKRFPEAEALLRESLVILQKKQPDEWTTFGTKSLLGGALLGQMRYEDAEPILLESYERLNRLDVTNPQEVKAPLAKTRSRLVELYDALGNKVEAEKWRTELEARRAAVEKTPPKP